MGNTHKIDSFRGDYYFLSNFFPCIISYKGVIFKSSEALYMAHKSGLEKDFIYFSKLSPGQAKREGKFIKLQEGWDEKKVEVMRLCIKLKFDQNPELRKMLLETVGLELIEGNTWGDQFWGVCKGKGQNWLGRLLMEYRDLQLSQKN